MNVRWIDVSIPLREGMATWPGDETFKTTPASRMARGDNCNVTEFAMTTHCGTHVDAPWHFEPEGKRIDEIEPSLFFGEALLLELAGIDLIQAKHLGAAPLPPRVLFKTRNAHIPNDGSFRKDFVGLAPDAAQRLVDDGCRLVGVDYLSVAPFEQPGDETHHCLLSNNVLVIEGLRFNGLSSGIYQFVALPLLMSGLDGSPCRAFIGQEIKDV